MVSPCANVGLVPEDVPLAAVRPQQDFFNTDHLHDDLKDRSVRGGAITLVAQATSFLLKLGSMAVLARLLGPEDFGLMTMVLAVTGVIGIFKDAGLSTATVQRAEISHAQVSTLFWINVAVSAVLALIVVALAPGVAWFYREPRLVSITLALAGVFLFGGLIVQHYALLQRQMCFGMLAIVQVVPLAASIVAGIVAAVVGLRYWTLVIMPLVSEAMTALLVWALCDWRPGLPSRGTGAASMIRFGANLTGFNFINYFARNADNILVGWYCGPAPLGIYSRAYQLLILPLSQIKAPLDGIAMPALSRLTAFPEQYCRYYYRAINTMMWLCGPPLAILAACSDIAVLVVLGRQWLPVIDVFKVFMPVAFLQPIYSTIGWVFVSRGEADRNLRWGMIACPIMVLSFCVGLPFGPRGVAAAYSAVFLALLPWTFLYTFRGSQLSLRGLAKCIAAPGYFSVSIFLAAELSRELFATHSVWIQLLAAIGAMSVTAVIAFIFVRSIRDEMLGIAQTALAAMEKHGRRPQDENMESKKLCS